MQARRKIVSRTFAVLFAASQVALADDPPRLLSAPEVHAPTGTSFPPNAAVRLQLTIDTTGAVSDVVVLEGIAPTIDAEIMSAARRMRFSPARRDGQAVVARIRFRYRLQAPSPVPPPRVETPRVQTNPTPNATPRNTPRSTTPRPSAPSNDEPLIVVRGRHEPGAATRETFRAEELTTVPGTFGEPLRVVGSLPGVGRSPLGVGFFLVRGASFENTGFLIDGFPVLNLYHFGAGPSVISPRFVSELEFYPGNYPVAYGRFSAGLISVRTDLTPPPRPRLEAEIDLFRASLFGALPFDNGRGVIALAARRSYYDPLLALVTPGVSLNFGDLQGRIDYQFSPQVRASLFAFASSDSFSVGALGPFYPSDRRDGLLYDYWRGIARVEYRGPRGLSVHWSGMVGYDSVRVLDSRSDQGSNVSHLRGSVAGSRASVRLTSAALTSTIGVEGLGQAYETVARETGDPIDPIAYGFVSIAAYAEEVLRIGRLELTAGARMEYVKYRTHERLLGEPRAVARVRMAPWLTAVGASGMFHQIPNALLLVAGFSLPPQRAWQNSLGVEFDVGALFDARVTGFFNWLYDLPRAGSVVPSTSQLGGNVDPSQHISFTGQGRAYGLEVMLRRRLERGLYGWVSYTLSRSERFARPDAPIRLFNYDQPHVLNIALSWKINDRWRVGGRFQFAMGNPAPNYDGGTFQADDRSYSPYVIDDSGRAPVSHQLDLRADHYFRWGPVRMNAFLDVMNVYNNVNGDLGWTYRYDYSRRVPSGGLPIVPTIGLRGEL